MNIESQMLPDQTHLNWGLRFDATDVVARVGYLQAGNLEQAVIQLVSAVAHHLKLADEQQLVICVRHLLFDDDHVRGWRIGKAYKSKV